MTVDTTTGEIVETIGAGEARRLTTEAQNELRSSRDHFDKAWSLIEQAVSGGGHLDLGYRSPGDYLHAEFDGVLSGLDVAARRVAVRTLTDWGLSTRAIAPVVGVGKSTIDRDQQVSHVGHLDKTPEPSSGEAGGSGQTSTDSTGLSAAEHVKEDVPASEQASSGGGLTTAPAAPPVVTGIDGKTYTRPEPRTRPRATEDEWSDQDRAEELARNLSRNLSLLYAVTNPERRAEYIAAWSRGTHDVRPLGADFITPQHMRDLSAALLDFATEWENAHA